MQNQRQHEDTLRNRVIRFCFSVYKGVFSPWMSALFGASCRFSPTCSEYASEALQQHGILRGGRLAFVRLCRCHPLGGEGYDPVPAANAHKLKHSCHPKHLT